jgi:hypothetical protein
MASTIRWTAEVVKTYEAIILYLQNEWSDKEVTEFANRVNRLLITISNHPYLFKASKYRSIRKAVIGKQNTLFYFIRNDEIILLTFWDNRQSPAKNELQ